MATQKNYCALVEFKTPDESIMQEVLEIALHHEAIPYSVSPTIIRFETTSYMKLADFKNELTSQDIDTDFINIDSTP